MPSALSALIVDRLAPASRQKLQTPLSDATAAALRQFGVNRLLAPAVSDDTKAELMAAGYAKETLGGIVLTDIGHVRAMMETGQ